MTELVMTAHDLDILMGAYNELDSAAQGMISSQPYQMTEAAARLETARMVMHDVLQRTIRNSVGQK